jgi:hypothetical protein
MTYMIPSDEATVEAVARAIARSRIHRDADQALIQMVGISIQEHDRLEASFDRIFEMLWQRDNLEDNQQKADYREDARAAISALNLKLLISPT